MAQNTCKKCHHECHCGGREHIDEYADICPCNDCDCKTTSEVVVDDTGECESCQ